MNGTDREHIVLDILDRNKLFNKNRYDEAYEFWKTEWAIAICDLGLEGLSVNISDKFIVADEIIILMQDQEIAALGLINYLDLSLTAYKDTSYLKAMPSQAMSFIFENKFEKLMVSSYNIVSRKFRRTLIGNTLFSVVLPGVAISLQRFSGE